MTETKEKEKVAEQAITKHTPDGLWGEVSEDGAVMGDGMWSVGVRLEINGYPSATEFPLARCEVSEHCIQVDLWKAGRGSGGFPAEDEHGRDRWDCRFSRLASGCEWERAAARAIAEHAANLRGDGNDEDAVARIEDETLWIEMLFVAVKNRLGVFLNRVAEQNQEMFFPDDVLTSAGESWNNIKERNRKD